MPGRAVCSSFASWCGGSTQALISGQKVSWGQTGVTVSDGNGSYPALKFLFFLLYVSFH
jgi:hypothetical protein